MALLHRPRPWAAGSCLSAFRDEIRGRTADVFYVRITKDMTVDEKRQKYNEAKILFVQAEVAHPNMKPHEVKLLLIKERLACMTPHGKWQDRWLDHPFPTMSEPEKAVAYLTDFGDYDEEHKAWLYNKASMHGVDSFFNQVRRRLSLLERPIHSKSNNGPIWNGYSPYNPKKSSWNLLRTPNMLNLQDYFVKFWLTVGVATASPKFNEIIFHLQHLKRPRYVSNCLF